MRRTIERALTIVPAALAAAMFAALGAPVLRGRTFLWGDLAIFHLPVRFAYARALVHHENIFWLPDIFAGFYVHGEGQAGLLHPLHLLLYRALPLTLAFHLELVAGYAAAYVGMVLFLRRHTLGRPAALTGAFVFAFCGFNVGHLVHPNMVEVIAHVPWLLLAIDVALRDGTPGRVAAACLAIGLLTTSQVLLGHPQALWLSVVIEGLYVVCALPPPGMRVLLVAAAMILGFVGGAAQWLPTWESLEDSSRAHVFATSSYMEGLHGTSLLQFISPYLPSAWSFSPRFPEEAFIYCGAVAWIGLVWLVFQAAGSRLSRLSAWTLAMIGLGIVLALGDRGYVYRLVAHLPIVGRFRGPSRDVVLAELGLAVAAALLVDGLVTRRRTLAFALVLIGGLEQGYAALAFVRAHVPANTIEAVVQGQAGPPDRRGPRIQSPNNILLMSGLRLAGGYAALPPAGRLDPLDARRLRLAGVRWVEIRTPWAAEDTPRIDPPSWRGEVVGRSITRDALGGTAVWAEVLRPLPRARMLTKAVVTANPQSIVDGVDVDSTAIVESPLDLPDGLPGSVEIVRDAPGDIELTATTGLRQLLVLSERWHPGWHVRLDNTPQPVVRTYGDFLGAAVESGRHTVTFQFQPSSVRVGVALSLTGLALLCLMALLVRRRARPGRQSAG